MWTGIIFYRTDGGKIEYAGGNGSGLGNNELVNQLEQNIKDSCFVVDRQMAAFIHNNLVAHPGGHARIVEITEIGDRVRLIRVALVNVMRAKIVLDVSSHVCR